MAEDVTRLKRGLAGGEATPVGLTYRLAAAGASLSMIVPRTVAGGGLGAPTSGELTGIAEQTFPGGGEPSAVKSGFCSASVFATGTGVTAGLFLPRTCAVRRNAPCRAAADCRLFPSANGLCNKRFPSSSWTHVAGGHSLIDNRAIARKHESQLQGCPTAETRRHTLERQ